MKDITTGIALAIWPCMEYILINNGGFHLVVDRDNKHVKTIQLTVSLVTRELSDEQINEINNNLSKFCQLHGIKGSDGCGLVLIKRNRRIDENGHHVIELVWD